MRNKQSATIRDMYAQYHKDNKNDVSYNTFKTILNEFNSELKNCLLESSEGFKMPFGLGYVQIVKYKPKSYTKKSLSIDYKSSAQYGKIVYYLNEHSNGYKYRLYWSKIPQTFSDRYKYQLQLVRQNKRHLAQLIFNHKDYINVDDIQIYKMRVGHC